jgi:hypothetical protein
VFKHLGEQCSLSSFDALVSRELLLFVHLAQSLDSALAVPG